VIAVWIVMDFTLSTLLSWTRVAALKEPVDLANQQVCGAVVLLYRGK